VAAWRCLVGVIELVAASTMVAPLVFTVPDEVAVDLGGLADPHITVASGDRVTGRTALMETAHPAFAAPDAAQFWIEGTATVAFEKPGIYEYDVRRPQAVAFAGR